MPVVCCVRETVIGWRIAARTSARLIAAALALGSAGVARAQCTASWTVLATTGPTARSYASLTWNPGLGAYVLYAGGTSSAYRQDLWRWTGTAWAQIAATTPPGVRRGMLTCMAGARSTLVVFGGAASAGIVGDTWEWDGTGWTNFAVAGPPARGFGAMVHDSTTGHAVVFGGWGSGTTYYDDTWTWNGSAWTQATFAPGASPSARGFHAMAYDPVRHVAVMFGGLFNTTSSSTYLGDLWEYDGESWTQRAFGVGPEARAYHAMSYDAATGKVVLFGGFNITHGNFNDTWGWDGTSWTPYVESFAPLARVSPALASAPELGTTLLFGGQSGAFRQDTWQTTLACAAGCDADVNGDGNVDQGDVDYLVDVVGGGANPSGADPDFNRDGNVDQGDVDALIDVVAGGSCP